MKLHFGYCAKVPRATATAVALEAEGERESRQMAIALYQLVIRDRELTHF